MALPVAPSRESQVVSAVNEALGEMGVERADRALHLKLDLERWRDSGEPSVGLEKTVKTALESGHVEFGAVLANQYLILHKQLRINHHLSFDEATRLFSHALLVLTLAKEGAMSSSQISRVLAARDSRLVARWQPVKLLLEKLNFHTEISVERIEKLIADDQSLEEIEFADSDRSESIELVGETAERMGFGTDLSILLRQLVPDDKGEIHWPYLQILHYQCAIAEYYDHASSYAYEFAPRGAAAATLFREYEGLADAQNPFLNNAKALNRFTSDWADTRDKSLSQARALAAILLRLETMGFSARRELAGLLRRLLFRIARLNFRRAVVLSEFRRARDVRSFLKRFSRSETQSRGIIEQRVVDALSSSGRGMEGMWRSRGLGDSVNATNISRRKLGDCDYQDAEKRRVLAFESHGGTLTQTYFDGHLISLKKALARRIELEWFAIAEPAEWDVNVTFVAHSFRMERKKKAVLLGVRVQFQYLTFEEFINIESAKADDKQLLLAVNLHLIKRLNEISTPQSVRERFKSLASTK